ncbi:MAG: xanthine dehydrogenase family protein molybdopterin-binding subunit [Acidobacteria bacterium]|nr:xanthine dehydrogenase family protein molybdopterin-binding subunit [Acidobacteriota bacterium]
MSVGISRRDFLKGAGALMVSFGGVATLETIALGQGPFATHMSHIDPSKLDSWIAVGEDGLVTAYTGKCDFGQGMYTAQTQLVAEELCVALERVRLMQCDTSVTPDQGTTSGSQSTPTNFNDGGLAQSAATAREALLEIASRRFNVPTDQLNVVNGLITAKDGTRVTYGELIRGKHFKLTVNPTAKRIAVREWTVLGKPIPSLDIQELVTGQFEFVHNVRLPGMLHGRVVRPPAVGATLVSIDERSVEDMPGLVKVVVRRNFVGVVAEKQVQAEQAASKLRVNWSKGGGNLPAQRLFYEYMREQPSRDVLAVDSGDVNEKLGAAVWQLRATYQHPYQAHGSIGASCAVADVQDHKATIWSPTQSVYPTRSGVAQLLGLPADNVRVIFVRGSGCYGLNGADTVSYDAALLSQGVRKPVRVQLTRQDEMAWGENYGAACVIDQRAGLDEKGSIMAWDCETWSVSLGGRPGYEHPGNVITGSLVGFEPQTISPQAASQPTGELRNGSNIVPSYVVGCIGGKCGGAGKVRSERVLAHTVKSPFFTGPLRSPLRLQNTFAHECFMDELSAHVKADPVAYRLQHLNETRLMDVVKAAAKGASWEERPSPKSARLRRGVTSGRGIACVAYEGDNGYVALVAEVEVDQASGRVQPKRFVVAQDCGPISNPAGMRNQIEGGVLQGMSRALGEEITWDQNKITSTSWRSYHSLPLGMELPTIESVLINRSETRALGAGETAITVVAAAIANAIFDATGARVRQLPLVPARVKAALEARS